jgi:alpha-tubulin suppressor-like RCC1 family protein
MQSKSKESLGSEKESQRVVVWGSNSHGQLGLGIAQLNVEKPLKLGFQKTVVQVAMGDHHSVFLVSNGECYSCGDNFQGQLHQPNFGYSDSLMPVKLAEQIEEVSCGSKHTIFLTRNGKVLACGSNSSGQLAQLCALGQSCFSAKKLCEDVRRVWAGGNQTFLLKSSNEVLVCGDNQLGQLSLPESIPC